MLECLGDQECHFILIFDNGYFSEFGTFSITDWIGHVPIPLLAKNFGVPESTFNGFPKDEVYFAVGAIPVTGTRSRIRATLPAVSSSDLTAAFTKRSTCRSGLPGTHWRFWRPTSASPRL